MKARNGVIRLNSSNIFSEVVYGAFRLNGQRSVAVMTFDGAVLGLSVVW